MDPSSFRLKNGESATYYVTITNESVPAGEWRFGSLTWKEKDGNYSVYTPIAVSAAFVRWELIIPGGDDIDLFLEDSGGNIIASSTKSGTDELIELMLPADDTYTMVVHGWSVPNEPLPYNLHYWAVPLASGGSLSVDSAPASAEIGVTAAVDVSWTGLAAGTNYLGAVSHTGDSGLLGLTLVEVSVE